MSEALRYNTGKPQLAYIMQFPSAMAAVARVMEFGAAKYADGNWQKGNKPDKEYLNSCMRHLVAMKTGPYDEDSACSHLGHAIWNLLALQQLNHTDEIIDTERFDERCEFWALKKAEAAEQELAADKRQMLEDVGFITPGSEADREEWAEARRELLKELEAKKVELAERAEAAADEMEPDGIGDVPGDILTIGPFGQVAGDGPEGFIIPYTPEMAALAQTLVTMEKVECPRCSIENIVCNAKIFGMGECGECGCPLDADPPSVVACECPACGIQVIEMKAVVEKDGFTCPSCGETFEVPIVSEEGLVRFEIKDGEVLPSMQKVLAMLRYDDANWDLGLPVDLKAIRRIMADMLAIQDPIFSADGTGVRVPSAEEVEEMSRASRNCIPDSWGVNMKEGTDVD